MSRKVVQFEGNGGKDRRATSSAFFTEVDTSPPSAQPLCSYMDRATAHVAGSTDRRMMIKETTFQCLGQHRPLLNQCGCPVKQVTSNPTGTSLLPLPRMSWKISACIGI